LRAFGYAFERVSDTEVLLRAYQHWGAGVVHHLRGMFAFAIWDARNERLFLARDRFGEKPLFLYEDSSGLYFGSAPGYAGFFSVNGKQNHEKLLWALLK
jgi:asparagine synthase (glutamine-hydrolysing)